MPSPLSERMPNGMDATLALLPDRWKKLLLAKSGIEQDGPAIADRVVKPEWASNSNPVEISAPYATQGPLVQGRDPGEMVVARNYVSQRPRPLQSDTPQPVVDTTYRPPQPDELPAQTTPIAPPSIQRNLPDTRSVNEPVAPPSIQANVPDTERTMPVILPRNFSSSMFAPTQTQNPDYAPQVTATRPKVVDELGYAETHTPMPRHGRFVEALKGAGLGFLRGVGTTGTIGGGLGGAATLGTMSAIDPKYAESAQNQMFTIPRLQQQEAIRVGRQSAATKQAEAQAGLRKTQAETADILDRPIRERIKTAADIEKDNRTRTEVERHNKVMETLTGTSRADSQKRFEETSRHNKAMEDIGRGRNQATGYGQDVVAENENSRADFQNQRDDYKAAQDAITNYNKLKIADRQNFATGKAVERDIADTEAEMERIRAKGNPDDPVAANVDLTEQDRSRYAALVKKRGDLEEKYNTFLEQSRKNADEMNVAGEEIQTKHQKYARQRSDGTYETTTEPKRQPVRSRRMPAQATVPPISENDFVEAARQKMGRSFDEAKARAAWQKKYGGH